VTAGIVLDVLAAVLVVGFVAVAVLAVRRRVITRRGGTFDCSLRLRTGASGQGWALGIGRYAGDTLEWYRVFSYATRPRRVLPRRQLEIVDRRLPEGAEVFALLSGAVVVRCREGNGSTVELAMGEDVLTGFLAWLEATSPGHPA
jgi:hypothetical protein